MSHLSRSKLFANSLTILSVGTSNQKLKQLPSVHSCDMGSKLPYNSSNVTAFGLMILYSTCNIRNSLMSDIVFLLL